MRKYENFINNFINIVHDQITSLFEFHVKMKSWLNGDGQKMFGSMLTSCLLLTFISDLIK